MNKELIATKNDIFRKTFIGGMIVLTPSVSTSENKNKIIDAVRGFDDFNLDNDPYEEHDFGKVIVEGESYFFKIDYYDLSYRYFQKDGNRVITIMRADEY
jgi:hypothetical protein